MTGRPRKASPRLKVDLRAEEKLRDLVTQLAGSDDIGRCAATVLLDAADGYRQAFPYQNEQNLERTSRNQVLEELTRLQASLGSVANSLSALSIESQLRLFDGPGQGAAMSKYIEDEATRIERTLDAVHSKFFPDAEDPRFVLAFDVARAMRDILKIEPAVTRDDGNITGEHGGAAYARLLRATMDVAGIALTDILPLLQGGLHLLIEFPMQESTDD